MIFCLLSTRKYTLLIQCVWKVAVHCAPPDFYLWGAAKSAVYRDCPRMLNELKTAITAYIRNAEESVYK